MKYDFKSDIRDRNGFSEPIFDFEDPEFLWIFLLLLFDMFSNIFDRLDDILNSGESAFAPNHITDGELELFFILESVFNLILILFLLFFEMIFYFIILILWLPYFTQFFFDSFKEFLL